MLVNVVRQVNGRAGKRMATTDYILPLIRFLAVVQDKGLVPLLPVDVSVNVVLQVIG